MKKSPSTKKSATKKAVPKKAVAVVARDYDSVLSSVVELLQEARRASARTVNAIMTATYWEIGRRIVEFEQGGKERAAYGEELLKRLADDLTSRFGRGFSQRSIEQMRRFHLGWQIAQTPSAQSHGRIAQTPSAQSRNSLLGSVLEIMQTPSDLSAGNESTEKSQTPSGQFVTTKYATASHISVMPFGLIFQMPSENLEANIRQTVSAESVDRIAQTPSAQLAGPILQSPIGESGPEPPFSLLDALRRSNSSAKS